MQKLQNLVHTERLKRNFTMSYDKIFMILIEEIGEIATELKNEWSVHYSDFDKQKLVGEIADAQIGLIALANQFNIDIETEVKKKFDD